MASQPSTSTRLTGGVVAAAVLVLLAGLLGTVPATAAPGAPAPAGAAVKAAKAARTGNPATPGSFTGYGFDQCVAPTQSAMDAWLTSSPFWAVGIYISGDSRACRDQPNLTPTWVSTQLANGWRLLPITLGPQASCTTRDRYQKQVRIDPKPAGGYAAALAQGRAEADKAVATATALGIVPGSTLFYDLEGDFSTSNTDCRESALTFVSGWVTRLHELGYLAGYYSSAGTGIKMLDDAAVLRPGTFAMPDHLWVARWSGTPNRINESRTTYLRDTSWSNHQRVHQYRGGHNETHGGVTINIDSNWVDLGTGSVARTAKTFCGGVPVDYPVYSALRVGATGDQVRAAQCLLRQKKKYAGEITGTYDAATAAATSAYRTKIGLPARGSMSKAVWTSILARGSHPLMKYGATGHAVRRLQRALNAADRAGLAVSGVYEATTTAAVRRYQADNRLPNTGVVTDAMWAELRKGNR
jgi:peptidoglycan hydrolase-like protein with peptidoglycan-binding domain